MYPAIEMRWSWSLVALATVAVGCNPNDCAQSADIQVTVAPNGDVTIGDIARLHVMLSVADGPVRSLDIVPSHAISPSGSAFILRPDTPPPMDKYDVSMTVQAFDEMNDLIAIGSESMQAVTKGCNRLTVHLAALPVSSGPVDMAIPPGGPFDLAGVVPPDLAGCIGGTPDEDSDGRANSCDLCPADPDPTPVDTDGDGLPDACDPDPMMKSNTLAYFDPMNSASGHWSGSNTIQNSYMTLDTNGPQQLASGNATDSLPTNVRVQTHLYPVGYYSLSSPIDAGMFVGTSTNLLGTNTNGAWCFISTSDRKLELYPVQAGVPGTAALASIGTVTSTVYRLRLTNSNGVWTCEMVVGNNTPVTVTTTQPVTGPLFVTLIVDNAQVNFHSVVAETKL